MNTDEIELNAKKAAADYCKDKGISAGLTGKQHAGILLRWAKESEAMSDMERWIGFNYLANCSALRQRLEKAKVLSASTVAISNDYI